MGTTDFRQIYDEHFDFVWRSLRRLGVREPDAPDAVQEVFLISFQKLPEFERRSKLTTWLFAIAMRVAARRRRVAYERHEVPSETAQLDGIDERANLEETAEQKDGMALVEDILDTMPLEQRAVFTLFELDNLSGQEIAEVLGTPVGTVHSRLRLAREAFRRGLARAQARDRFGLAPIRFGEVR